MTFLPKRLTKDPRTDSSGFFMPKNMELIEHIKYIRGRVIDAISEGDDMNAANFGYEEGLLMTFNEAKEIVRELDRLNAEKADLLAALKGLDDFIAKQYPWALSQPFKGLVESARAAIAKAETV